METQQIGRVAKKSGVPIDTIRYYEKRGLLKTPERSEGGFRKYPEKTTEQLRFIKRAQDMGFTLKEIKDVMQCSEAGLKPCCDLVRRLLEKKLGEFEIKIKDLQRMRKNLKSLLSEWVPLKEAKRRTYTVCPQIETQKKGGRRHVKKKG